jgi:hypothetical protein
MCDAEINDAITKLYKKVNTYSTEDWWYFDVPLAIQLRKPLRSRQCWLVNARILANKSADQAMIRQMSLNQYFTHLPSIRKSKMHLLKGLDQFESMSRQIYWIYLVPVCWVQAENPKSLALIRY